MAAVSDYSYDAKNYDDKMAELCAFFAFVLLVRFIWCAGSNRVSVACRQAEGGEFWSDWNESSESFDQMDLHENLLRGIYAYGMHPASRDPKRQYSPCPSHTHKTEA